MKKLFFILTTIILLAAGCNTATPNQPSVSTQPIQQAPITQQKKNSHSSTKANTDASQTLTPNGSGTQAPPRDPSGLIHQLKITASTVSRSIAFTSQENYTNCTDELTVITVDENQQPVFISYKDSGSINLFAGDEHSTAFGSLFSVNGSTLAADIISGKFGDNAAGTWGLICDQGQYSLVVSKIK